MCHFTNMGKIDMRYFLNLSAVEAEAAMKPQFIDGKWKQPYLSRRRIAMVKKNAQQNGTIGQWIPGQGGWLETWDTPQKYHVMRPPKGHKHERNELERVQKIQTAMAAMPNKIAEHKKVLQQARVLTGLEKWLNAKEEY